MAVAAALLAPAPAATAHVVEGPDVFYFIGGGWGHGVGMSQYGALGRAEAGFSHVEILQFYYDNTEVRAAPELVPDDVDVRLAVHNSSVFTPTGQLTVAVDGSILDTTSNRLTVRRVSGGWHINSSNVDWCGGFCSGTVLTVSFVDGEPVRVPNVVNGTHRYAHGQFQLTPDGPGVSNCGRSSANQYCLVIGDMTMQQYLYGVDEVPQSWHAETLKAQAVAARSYTASKITQRENWGAPFDLYGSVQDQEYHGWDQETEVLPRQPWVDSVDATDDVVVLYTPSSDPDPPYDDPAQPDGSLDPYVVTAFYSSSNGGYTASSEEPWRQPLPYLRAKPDAYDSAPDADGNPQNPLHSWWRHYSYEEVSGWLTEYPIADLDVGDIQEIRIEQVGPSGRIDDALVTLVGSKRTLEVRKSNGEPYGYRFYFALVRGCRNTQGCSPMLGTKVRLSDGPPGSETGGADPPEPGPETPDDTIPDTESDGGLQNPEEGPVPFEDVAADAVYKEAVDWIYRNEITLGTSPTTFSPDDSLTRAQFASFLWRLAGRPTFEIQAEFSDVAFDSNHFAAISWMAETRITEGCGDGRFCPNKALTAAQIATFMWRYAGSPIGRSAIPFDDVEGGGYYVIPVRWMLDWDLWVDEEFRPVDTLTSEFRPHSPITRSRMAVYLFRLADAPGAFDPAVELPSLIRSA